MNTAAVRANRRKLLILAAIVLLCAAGYMLVEVNFSNPKLLAYAMKIRTPKLIVMLITAFSIGGASLVFQSIINNTIVTPCLLGMNSLYTLIHTAVVFYLQLDLQKDQAQCAVCAVGGHSTNFVFQQHSDYSYTGHGPQ